MGTPQAAAIYARISSDQDGHALGVARQVEDCERLADRLGWKVAERYVDNDVSATHGKRRPAYQRMLDDLVAGSIDAVLVYHADRLTRRPIELEQFIDVVTRAGVTQVRFAAGADVDLANGDGLLVLRMLAAVAANESANKSRRVRRKHEEIAANGRPNGGQRAYGYEADHVTIRPAEAEVIRTLAQRFLAGESLRSLAQWLEDEGIPSARGKSWQTTTLRNMLRSARIAGLREHRGELIGPAVWDPIIMPETRQRILARFDQMKRSGRRAPRNYLLTGLLRCSRCTGKLFSAARGDERRYVCQTGPDHGGCGGTTIAARGVEELIAAGVLYRLDTAELADALAGRAAVDEEAATLAEAIAADRAQLDELAGLYASKAIGAREWMAARNPIEQRITGAERSLARLTDSSALTGLVGNGDALRHQWAELNLTRQHAIVAAVLDHAVIHPGKPGAQRVEPERVEPVWRL